MSVRLVSSVGAILVFMASSAYAQQPPLGPDEPSARLPDLSAWTLNLGFGFGEVSAGSLDSSVFTLNAGLTILSGVQWSSEDFGTYVEGSIVAHPDVPIYGIGLDLEFGLIDEGDFFSIAIPIDYVVSIDTEGSSAWPALTLGGRLGYSSASFDVERRDRTNSFNEFEEATMDFFFLEPVAGVRLFTAFGIVSLEAFVRIGIVVSSEFPARTVNLDDPSVGTSYGLRLYAAFGF